MATSFDPATSRIPMFQRLPLELRQMIYSFALAPEQDPDTRGEIALSMDETGILQSDAFATAKRLALVDTQAHVDILDTLSRSFTTLRIENSVWPLRYILRTFKNQGWATFRHSVKKVRISRLTILGLKDLKGLVYCAQLPHILPNTEGDYSELSAYVQQLLVDARKSRVMWVDGNRCFDRGVLHRLPQKDLDLGLRYLSQCFPNMKSLDIGLDVLECLVPPSLLGNGRNVLGCYILEPLVHLNYARNLQEVRVHWGEWLPDRWKEDEQHLGITEESVEVRKARFIELLEEKVPRVKIYSV